MFHNHSTDHALNVIFGRSNVVKLFWFEAEGGQNVLLNALYHLLRLPYLELRDKESEKPKLGRANVLFKLKRKFLNVLFVHGFIEKVDQLVHQGNGTLIGA